MPSRTRPRPQPRDDKTVEIADLTDESLNCRDMRHPWQEVTDFVLHRRRRTGEASIIEREMVCPRCAARRYDTYAVPSFETIKTRTVYPDGYLTKGVGRTSVKEIRRARYNRTHRHSLPDA